MESGERLGVITYMETGTQKQYIYAFVNGDDGNLYVNYFDGSKWQWINQGKPEGKFNGLIRSSGVAVTYLDTTAGKQHIYDFVGSFTGIGPEIPYLYANYFDGSKWQWATQNVGSEGYGAIYPGVITYPDAAWIDHHIYVFVPTYNGLGLNYRDASKVWKWQNQGQPPGTEVVVLSDSGVITYKDTASGKQLIYAFVRGADGTLRVNYRNTSSQWQWANQGKPPTNTQLVGDPGVISYRDPSSGKQLIYAFVRGADGNLYVNYWNGSKWNWANQGPLP